MGWTYEVTKLVKVDGIYQDVFAYRGESLLKAIFATLRARKESACVSFCLERLSVLYSTSD